MYRRALEALNQVAAGETPRGNDQDLAAKEYASLYERLQNEKLVTWGPTADIPVWAETPVKMLLAHAMRTEFDLPLAKLQEVKEAAAGALITIRKQLENEDADSPAPVSFF